MKQDIVYLCKQNMDLDGIKEIIAKDENRVLELKKTTGELIKGMQSLCAFLNTDGGWLFFGITLSNSLSAKMLVRCSLDHGGGSLLCKAA